MNAPDPPAGPARTSEFDGLLATATSSHPPDPVGDLACSLWMEAETRGYDCDPNLADLLFDQWVIAVVSCEHGKYQGTSDGFVGFTQAVGRAAREWADAHPPKPGNDERAAP